MKSNNPFEVYIERVPQYQLETSIILVQVKKLLMVVPKLKEKSIGKLYLSKFVKLSRELFVDIYFSSCRSSFQISIAHIINHTQRICYSE